MFHRTYQRLIAWSLCATMLALTGLGPVVRHAHGDEAIAHVQAEADGDAALIPSTTHSHVEWFGMELMLPEGNRPSAPTDTEVSRAWEAMAPHRSNAASTDASTSGSFAPLAVEPVALASASNSLLNTENWRPVESASSLTIAQLIVVLRI